MFSYEIEISKLELLSDSFKSMFFNCYYLLFCNVYYFMIIGVVNFKVVPCIIL